MEAALGELCRAGGWSYAAVWRFHPHDPRLLTLGESYCENEAKTVVERILNQVHIVGEGKSLAVLSKSKHSNKWKTSLLQGYTWWQHQFLNGIKTIVVLPLQLQGLVQFGSIRKVPRSSDFLNQCSIDALLERTIKHMVFLQSVTKYAEKIKQADEPKSGVVLKDNPDAGKNGGATWAYEVAGKTMVCPIIIEDLSPPGQMLVEMLCEERGLFLEIADSIRGFGLTILKGMMELHDGKIWARFFVEANREVTRMDIFLSLVQLLEQNNIVRPTEQMAKVMNNGVPSFTDHQRSPLPIPVGIAERMQ
nr:unnamed protein product [Digitaria exilis]